MPSPARRRPFAGPAVAAAACAAACLGAAAGCRSAGGPGLADAPRALPAVAAPDAARTGDVLLVGHWDDELPELLPEPEPLPATAPPAAGAADVDRSGSVRAF